MKTSNAALLLFSIAMTACAGSPCDDLKDKLTECGIESGEEVDLDACTDADEKIAECLAELSCDDIKGPVGTACLT